MNDQEYKIKISDYEKVLSKLQKEADELNAILHYKNKLIKKQFQLISKQNKFTILNILANIIVFILTIVKAFAFN